MSAQTPAKPATPASAADKAPAQEVTLDELYANGALAFSQGRFADAAASLDQLLAQASPDANFEQVYYMLAVSHLRTNNFVEAERSLKLLLEKYPATKMRVPALNSLGFASFRAGDYEAAAAAFKQLEAEPNYRSVALLGEGRAYLEAGKIDLAVEALRALVGDGIRSAAAAEGTLLLAQCYIKSGDNEAAIKILQDLRQHAGYLNDIFKLNSVAFKLGDGLLAQKKAEQAIRAYQIVLPKQQVVALEEDSIKGMKEAMAANSAAMKTDPARVPEIAAQNTILYQNLAEAQRQLDVYRQAPDFSPSYLLRLARAYSECALPWEALAIYGEFLRKYPEDPFRQDALFGIVMASADTGQIERIRKYAESYLQEFPNHPNADAVAYLLGASSLQASEPEAAETYFGRILADQPQSKYREQVRFLLGNARFDLAKYDLALGDYRTYLTDYPAGQFTEEAGYRIGLCQLMSGQEDAAAATLHQYLADYPHGLFVSDANYRLAVCKFDGSDFAGTIKDCDRWLGTFPGDALLGEVLTLKADSLAGLEESAAALPLYLRASQEGKSENIVGYALFQARKVLVKQRDWARIEAIFTDFLAKHPEHPMKLQAVAAVAQAKSRLDQTAGARAFLGSAVQASIADPEEENLGTLLTELARYSLKKDLSEPKADPVALLQKALGAATESPSPLAQARCLFARAELARLRKDVPGQQAVLQTIASKYPPKVLDAALLATVGDFRLEQGKTREAEACYQRLLQKFPKSPFREYAEVGLGRIAASRGQWGPALAHFQFAMDKAVSVAKLKDATLGKAKALLELGRMDEARPVFETVAGTREWRGEATAESLYSLGEIERRQGNLSAAVPFFQKVYLGYGRYPAWVARAYGASGACLEQLGDMPKAIEVYEEFLGRSDLQTSPEFLNARERLKKLKG